MHPTNNTSVTGAALGAALGCIVVYVVELLATLDVPSGVEGAVVVVCTAIVASIFPTTNDV
jgi:hypothetical protein